jgi:DNA-binding GntR family transcriptional regulator
MQLAESRRLWVVKTMSAQEIIEQFKALPPVERAQVTKFVMEHDDSWIPEIQGGNERRRGRVFCGNGNRSV